MIRIASQPAHEPAPAWHAGFLALLPAVTRHASIAFRHLKPEAHHDAVHEVIANALVAYARLVALGKANLAYATPLANYGIAQVRDGRKVASRHSVGDVLSQYAQRMKGFAVKRLDHFDERDGQWREAVVEDRRTPPPDQAAFRIDFPEWLRRHPERNQRIAAALAIGYRPGEVAAEFGMSPARVSQMRREFDASWQEFHGEEVDDDAGAAAVACGQAR
jgi:hypothetical protein